MNKRLLYGIGIVLIFTLFGCRKDINDGKVIPYKIKYPEIFKSRIPPMEIPVDNPMTVEGVFLGRKLFYEKKLSADNTQSCASCHMASSGFTDSLKFSVGIDDISGSINSMPIINLGWAKSFFWDGRSTTLELQALEPVINPVEMHNVWPNVVDKLQQDPVYQNLFKKAFNTYTIDSVLVAKALAQFERTLLSGNSPFDKYLRGEPTGYSQMDQIMMVQGYGIFLSEKQGDCFHCHGDEFNPLFTDNLFHNNGLDPLNLLDSGYAKTTGNPGDLGKFKTPTLRNLLFTAPYMHDGRFTTLDQVINHYSIGLENSPTLDPLMKSVDDGGVELNLTQRKQLLKFLESLTDSSFITNPDFQEP